MKFIIYLKKFQKLKMIINLYIQDYSIQTTIALENLDKFTDWWTETNIHTDQLLKISVIDFLCRFQQEFCLKKSTELFETIPLNYFLSPNNQTNKYILLLLYIEQLFLIFELLANLQY
jgi:hypothetical protein